MTRTRGRRPSRRAGGELQQIRLVPDDALEDGSSTYGPLAGGAAWPGGEAAGAAGRGHRRAGPAGTASTDTAAERAGCGAGTAGAGRGGCRGGGSVEQRLDPAERGPLQDALGLHDHGVRGDHLPAQLPHEIRGGVPEDGERGGRRGGLGGQAGRWSGRCPAAGKRGAAGHGLRARALGGRVGGAHGSKEIGSPSKAMTSVSESRVGRHEGRSPPVVRGTGGRTGTGVGAGGGRGRLGGVPPRRPRARCPMARSRTARRDPRATAP